MEFLIPLLATAVILLSSGALMSTVGRRRRHRRRALSAGVVAAIEGAVGSDLAALVVATASLRQRVDDVAERNRDMLAIERHLGGAPRRPLWRQIEDANFGHELDGLLREALAWLARVDALPGVERQLLDSLELDAEPIHALVRATQRRSHEPLGPVPPIETAPRDRSAELREVQTVLEGASARLRRFEDEISTYRGGGYR